MTEHLLLKRTCRWSAANGTALWSHVTDNGGVPRDTQSNTAEPPSSTVWSLSTDSTSGRSVQTQLMIMTALGQCRPPPRRIRTGTEPRSSLWIEVWEKVRRMWQYFMQNVSFHSIVYIYLVVKFLFCLCFCSFFHVSLLPVMMNNW